MTPPQDERPVAALLAPDILELLDESPADVAADTEEMHPADLADVAEAIPPERVADLLAALPPARAADVLEYLNEELRADVLETMSARQAAALIRQMTPDDRADVLDDLEEEVVQHILAQIPPAERGETVRLLQYDPDTAGGLMTTEFVSVPETMSVEQALNLIRAAARTERREALYTIYATDVAGHARGVLSLRELLAAPDGARVADVAWGEIVTVPATADREEIARITAEYDLLAVPVVDADQRILGVVTVDDVIDVIVEEQTEDAQKFGGMEALDMPYMQIGLGGMLRKRGVWLCALLVGEMLTISALAQFQGAIEQVAVLALFIPLIISSGGNSGSQATSLIVRAMALQEVRIADWWKVAIRELPTGLALGAMLAVLGILRIVAWQQMGWTDYGEAYWLIALTVGIALLGVVTFGNLAGSMLPFLMRRLGFDPASASAPFVATLVDVTGVLIYFGVALVLLRGTLL